MILNKSTVRLLAVTLILISVAGCRASGNHRAPIEDRDTAKKVQASGKRNSTHEQETTYKFYTVQKGDTLYSIAFEQGLDYREVAGQNNIENPSAIQIGQQIKLQLPDDGVVERPRMDIKPLAQHTTMAISRKDQPKIAKLPYSEQAVEQIEKSQLASAQPALTTAIAVPAAIPAQESETATDDGVDWGMPTKGKVIGEYSESANRKGVDIAGSKGQPVLASAAGKVVYSGSGLRGYGKLVIIKHNKTFLSAYAHNEQILVKEGESVTKGQKIAEMGSTDADQVKLHFEIRKFGKPVDPAKFLNLAKS